jgi:hypothetical protein
MSDAQPQGCSRKGKRGPEASRCPSGEEYESGKQELRKKRNAARLTSKSVLFVSIVSSDAYSAPTPITPRSTLNVPFMPGGESRKESNLKARKPEKERKAMCLTSRNGCEATAGLSKGVLFVSIVSFDPDFLPPA